MDEKHPNRKKDKHNPYTLTVAGGHYYLSFKDSRGVFQRIEIDKALYELFNRFELEDISYLNRVSRHIEHSELTEATLNDRAFYKAEQLEDVVARNMKGYIGRLPNCPKYSGAGLHCIFSGSCPMSRLQNWKAARKWRSREALILQSES